VDNVAGHVGEPVQITGWAYDPEEDPMTYTIEFGDGENATGSVDQGGSLSASHVYDTNGTYLVSLTVYDDGGGETAESLATIVPVGWNCPPSNVGLKVEPYMGREAGSKLMFSITAKDADGDSVDIDLDFGDDSTPFSQTKSSATTNLFVLFTNHTYAEAGMYNLTLTAYDGHNTTTANYSMIVVEGGGGGISTMLIVGIVAGAAVAAAVAVMLLRRRKGPKKEEGDVQLPV
jgi:PKD repeat protein